MQRQTRFATGVPLSKILASPFEAVSLLPLSPSWNENTRPLCDQKKS